MFIEDAEKLKCHECNNYLSCSPIFLKNNGENVCGRCTVSEAERFVVRNKCYETFASTMSFPCRYKTNGCTETIPWATVISHEAGCEYRLLNCLASDCNWSGRHKNLQRHFEEQHEDLMLTHPCVIKLDIVQDCEKCYLIPTLELLFILHVKYVVSSSKLWYCVRLLENPHFSSYFYYILKITNKDSSTLTMKKLVQPDNSSVLNSDNSVEINIKNMLEPGGMIKNYEDAIFTVSVRLKNNKCAQCDHELTSCVKLTDEGCLCKDCM